MSRVAEIVVDAMYDRYALVEVDGVVSTDHKSAAALLKAFTAALLKLRELAAGCLVCGGASETGERFEAYILTDDPRLIASPLSEWRRRRLLFEGSRVEARPRGAGVLKSPCRACSGIRTTLKTCEAAP